MGIFFIYIILPLALLDHVFVTSTMITQTVYGFLDFTTTIGGTVMIFSPRSAELLNANSTNVNNNIIDTKPIFGREQTFGIQPTKITSKLKLNDLFNTANVISGSNQFLNTNSITEAIPKTIINVKYDNPNVHSTTEPQQPLFSSTSVSVNSVINENSSNNKLENKTLIKVDNNAVNFAYNFLSRQPSEFAEETYKVINFKQSNHTVQKHLGGGHKPKASNATGLVTKISETVVNNGVVTVHETSVSGTYISGKYAQVLESTSHIYKGSKLKIAPSSTLRILKTANTEVENNRRGSVSTEGPKYSSTKPTQKQSVANYGRSSRKLPVAPTSTLKNRFRNKIVKDEPEPQPSQQTEVITEKGTSNEILKKPRHRGKSKSRRNKNTRSTKKPKGTTVVSSAENYTRRTFKPKPQLAAADLDSSTSLYKFKLNRTPGRWQYKTTPKPRITIRRAENEEPSEIFTTSPNFELSSSNMPSFLPTADSILDQNNFTSKNGTISNNIEKNINAANYVETLNVEISTPVNFKETYYEIATVKTPYTFQVGTVKNTRFITITTTIEKTLEGDSSADLSPLSGPLTENILARPEYTDENQNFLDSSIATLPPIFLSTMGETPPLETMTKSFVTTQNLLKTHILPIVNEEGSTSNVTLVQTYHMTRFITVTKTFPALEAFQFIPSKQLKDFNTNLDEAGSEINLELDFSESDKDEEDAIVRRLPANIELNDSKLLNNDGLFYKDPVFKKDRKSTIETTATAQGLQNLSSDQLQQLAVLQLLNSQALQTVPHLLPNSKPVIRLETLYTSHVIPIFNGQSTSYSILSKPIGTISRTEYELETQPVLPLPVPQVPLNNILQPQPQFQIGSTTLVTEILATKTESKVLKLTFGARTSYTTLFSTNIVPTTLTTLLTTTIPVQPTQAYPGYFQPPYVPFQFLG